MSAAMTCIKYSVIIFNVLFWLLGLAVLVIGIYVEVHNSDELRVTDSPKNSYGALLIVVGVVVFLVGIVGCYGAMKSHRVALIVFASIVAIIFIIEIVAGALAYHYRTELKDKARKGMQRTLNSVTTGKLMGAWNNVQADIKCCGVHNYSDWVQPNTNWYEANNGSTTSFPPGCCGKKYGTCHYPTQSHRAVFYKEGCYTKVVNDLRDNWKKLALAAILIGIFQLFGVAFGCGLQHHVKKGEYQVV